MIDLWQLNADLEAFKNPVPEQSLRDIVLSLVYLAFWMILRIIILTSNLLQFGIFSRDNILELCFIFCLFKIEPYWTNIDKKFISELFLYCSINKFQKLSPLSYDQEVYTLYRGAAECEDEKNVYWQSWTDSYNSALGFALKYNTYSNIKM